MAVIGNILWFVFSGLWSWIGWVAGGILCCITIIGIPWGLQHFKMALASLIPFGKEVVKK